MATKDTIAKAYLDSRRIFMVISPNISALGDDLENYKAGFKSIVSTYRKYFTEETSPSFVVEKDDITLWKNSFRGEEEIVFKITPDKVIVSNRKPIDNMKSLLNSTGTEIQKELGYGKLPVTQFTYNVSGNIKEAITSYYPYNDALAYIFTKTPVEKYDTFAFYIERDKPLVILQIRNSEIIAMFFIAPRVYYD